MTFEISKEQLEKLNKWIKDGKRTESRATMGERLEYAFMPCSLGMHIVVRDCLRKEEINLSDYENW